MHKRNLSIQDLINKARNNSKLDLTSGTAEPQIPSLAKTFSNLVSQKKSRSQIGNFIFLSKRPTNAKVENQMNKSSGDKSAPIVNATLSLKRSSFAPDKGPFSYPQPSKPPRPLHGRNIVNAQSKTSNNTTNLISESNEYSTITPSPSVRVSIEMLIFIFSFHLSVGRVKLI